MKETFWKNKAGLSLRSLEWPVERPRAVVAFLHGQGEHIGRYAHVAQWFNRHQIAWIGHDHQGFGKSEGQKGHAPGLEAYLDDVDILLDEVRQRYPDAPVFLYGHSMGGNLALNYALRKKPTGIKGLIATGPWIRLAFEPPAIKIWAGRLLKGIFPTLSLPTGLDVHKISRDTAVVEAYVNDPLVHDKVSAAAGIDLMEGAAWLNQYADAAPFPMLLMHGGADGLTSPPATAELSARLRGPISHREWSGLYHEIHNEPEKEEVFEFTYDWMSSHW